MARYQIYTLLIHSNLHSTITDEARGVKHFSKPRRADHGLLGASSFLRPSPIVLGPGRSRIVLVVRIRIADRLPYLMELPI